MPVVRSRRMCYSLKCPHCFVTCGWAAGRSAASTRAWSAGGWGSAPAADPGNAMMEREDLTREVKELFKGSHPAFERNLERHAAALGALWKVRPIGTLGIAMAFVLATYSSSRGEPRCCLRHVDRIVCLVSVPVVAGWKIADMLCCCKTYTGGECCTEVEKCGGKPPGCFCASPSVPAPKKPPPKKSSDERLAAY